MGQEDIETVLGIRGKLIKEELILGKVLQRVGVDSKDDGIVCGACIMAFEFGAW